MTPMQMPQQSPIPPALQALMALTEGLQQGQVSPTTPDGQPTIAGQAMQAAMPQQPQQPQMPGMQQAMRGAQVGAQQSLQDQQAGQQLLQNMVKQQREPQGGILGAPGAQGIPRMAEGGIVGYSGGGPTIEDLEVQFRREKEEEALRAMMKGLQTQRTARRAQGETAPTGDQLSVEDLRALSGIDASIPIPEVDGAPPAAPAAPAAPVAPGRLNAARDGRLNAAQDPRVAPSGIAQRRPAPAGGPPRTGAAPNPMAGGIAAALPGGSSEAIYQKAIAEANRLPTAPPSAGDALGRAKDNAAATREFLISQGVNPDLIKQQMKDNDALTDRRSAMLRGERERLQGSSKWDGIIAALNGARGYKGMNGTSNALRTAGEAGAESVAANQSRQTRLVDMELRVQELALQQRQALQNSEKAAAEGKMDVARAELLKAQELSAKRSELLAQIHGNRSSNVAQQESTAAQIAAQERIAAGNNRTSLAVANIGAGADGAGGGKTPAAIKVYEWMRDPKNLQHAMMVENAKDMVQMRLAAAKAWDAMSPMERKRFPGGLSEFIRGRQELIFSQDTPSAGTGGAAAPTKQRFQLNP